VFSPLADMMATIVLPARSRTDTSGLESRGEFQIRSRQVWRSGLKGGETVGIAPCRDSTSEMSGATVEGMDTHPSTAVSSEPWWGVWTSVIEPW
jgi:hypothetical protein